MRRLQLVIINIIIFLYQFEFISFEYYDIQLSFYRTVIFPLLLLLLIVSRRNLFKSEIPTYLISILFFSFNLISYIGYDYFYSNLITVLGNVLQLLAAYLYFRDNRIEKSTLYVLSTWGLFQLPFFVTSFFSGSLGLANRFMGFHWDPNYLCMAVLISFWAKIYIVLKDTPKFLKILFLFLSFTDILMILFSFSRGGILALTISGLIYLFVHNRKLFYISCIGSMFIFFYMIERSLWITWDSSLSLVDSIVYRIFVTAKTGDISAGRIDFIKNYISFLKNGNGVVIGIPISYYIENINNGHYPHNTIIEFLLQGGAIIGGIFYLFIVYNFTHIGYYILKSRNLPYEFLFILSGFSVLMFLSFQLKISWLFVGLIFAISNKKKLFIH